MLKKLVIVLLGVILMLPFSSLGEDYQNPMTIPGQYPPIRGASYDYGIGDPFVMRFNGLYYLYASSCEDRVRVYTSRDLINWEFQGWCTENKDVYFAYAPEVIYWRGDFYMITSPNGGGHYILKSDSPLGVFRPVTGNFGYQIDGSFFVEDDGRLMILFPEDSQIKQAYLNPDTLLPNGIKYSTTATLRHWTEGPGLFRRGEWYYLTFTGNHVLSSGYRVAYASRLGSSAGKFTQPADDTILIHSVFGDDFTGLGHSSNFIGPDLDSLYTAYHSFVNINGPARLYNLDRLFTNGGVLYTTGPTNFSMPAPNMPDVYGDAAGELNDFSETEAGYFAAIPETKVFTQECNFALEENGEAIWQAGRCGDQPVTVRTNGKTISLHIGETERTIERTPELGASGTLHTLRVECNTEMFYAYIDGMRLITLAHPGFTASEIGAVKGEGAVYSFMACTAQALGSGDNGALKVIPGTFSAIHALNSEELSWQEYGKQMEKVPTLGTAYYAVRVAEAGNYCFDLTVLKEDGGKQFTMLLDGEPLLNGTVPAFNGKEDFFTFTSLPVSLPAGDHILTAAGDEITVSRIGSFRFAETMEYKSDFADKQQRKEITTLGAFAVNFDKAVLSVKQGKTGFALLGREGYTNYEMRVRFIPPVNGSGASGILIRGSNVSLFDAQVKESYFGYGVILSKIGFNVQKMHYGSQSMLGFTGVDAWKNAAEAEIVVRVQGNTLSIGLPGEEPLFVFEDAQPFTHGLCGFFSTGKELTVLSCNITPLY